MIGPLLFLFQQGPEAHYAGGASSKTAGTTALAGHIFRFLLTTVPQWIQLAGIFIGVPTVAIVAWLLWKRRRQVWAWWLARSGLVHFAIIGAAGVVVLTAAGSGLWGYNYVMHQNDFCQSCHIMDVAWNRLQTTAHKDLQCHACHRQPMYASTVELYFWVTERRMAVAPHDKVPTEVCSECHLRKGTDSARTLITLTAGHAVHLKSDSSALKNVQCITCHGRDFHVFIPNNSTCEQSGCHTTIRVNLGAMSRQSFRHCTMCHDFKSRVDPGVTVVQARAQLVPKALNCSACHAMTEKMLKFDLAADPHRGNCGSCHDPHKQMEPKDAYKSCATAQCHASADTLTAFHRGLGGHKLDQCGACHQAHSWKVNGTDCLACHKNIFQDRPPSRRSTSFFEPSALGRPVSATPAARPIVQFASFTPAAPIAARRAVERQLASVTAEPPASRQGSSRDSTFLHSRHKALACTNCHGTTQSHGALKITAPSGCLACHHGTAQRATCTTCHTTAPTSPYPVQVSFAISARTEPVTRTLSFAHALHGTLECTRCHGSDVNRSATTTCATCHADHHAVSTNCAGCHPTARTGHDRSAHEGCARCHTDARVAALPAARTVCLACHQEQKNHYPGGDCGTCHIVKFAALSGRPATPAGSSAMSRSVHAGSAR